MTDLFSLHVFATLFSHAVYCKSNTAVDAYELLHNHIHLQWNGSACVDERHKLPLRPPSTYLSWVMAQSCLNTIYRVCRSSKVMFACVSDPSCTHPASGKEGHGSYVSLDAGLSQDFVLAAQMHLICIPDTFCSHFLELSCTVCSLVPYSGKFSKRYIRKPILMVSSKCKF